MPNGDYSSVPSVGMHTDEGNEYVAFVLHTCIDSIRASGFNEVSSQDVREQIAAYFRTNLVPESAED